MDIIKLQPGERAPRDSDCARIEQKGGEFHLNASALVSCGDSSNEAESVALVGGDPYPSYDDAEGAALAWAASHGVAQLYIEPPEDSAPAA